MTSARFFHFEFLRNAHHHYSASCVLFRLFILTIGLWWHLRMLHILESLNTFLCQNNYSSKHYLCVEKVDGFVSLNKPNGMKEVRNYLTCQNALFCTMIWAQLSNNLIGFVPWNRWYCKVLILNKIFAFKIRCDTS